MKKNVWIISDSEPIPQLTGSGRIMRAGQFAEYFSEIGCNVSWFASTWLHYEERFYSNKKEIMYLNENLKLILLHAKKAYKKHVSLERILYCKRIEKCIKKEFIIEDKPDVIICSWPLIELGYQAVKYGKKNNIPVIIDIRDLWPDIFSQPFNGILKNFAEIAINILYGRKTRYALKNAIQIIGVTDDALKMAYKWGRTKKELDKTIYLSKKIKKSMDKELGYEYWKSYGVCPHDFIVIYVGSIHFRNAQLNIVIDAADYYKGTNVKFILCGKGPDFETISERTKDNPNLILAGYRNAEELDLLSEIATIGLLPYSNTPDFINALPNKLSEYLSHGLIVFTTLKGVSKAMIEKHKCGEFFDNKEKLIEKIELYLSDERLVEIKKSNAFDLFQITFNADNTYRRFCKDIVERI